MATPESLRVAQLGWLGDSMVTPKNPRVTVFGSKECRTSKLHVRKSQFVAGIATSE